MSKAQSTPSHRDAAAIYRKTAKMVEEAGGLTCVRICYAQDLEYDAQNHLVLRFREVFELDLNYFQCDDEEIDGASDHRVVALCLMAAMEDRP